MSHSIVSDSRWLLLTPGIIAVAGTASAADVPPEFRQCRAMTSSVARLDCYDMLVDAASESTTQAKPQVGEALPPTSTTPATIETGAGLSQEELFGQDQASIRKTVDEQTGEKEFDRIEARIVALRKSASGKTVITLDNGQVWQQIDAKRVRLSENDLVTIRKRSMGSFTLYNEKTAIRVKRIS